MQSDKSKNFNERLSQWIASQGFWFQVRHSMAGGGSGAATFHAIRLGLRLLLFIGVVTAGAVYYLSKRSERSSFHAKVEKSLGEELGGTETRLEGFNRVRSDLMIGRLGGEGGQETFYSWFSARGIRCKMGLFEGIFDRWQPGTIRVERLDMEVRAGADNEESAAKIAKGLFKSHEQVDISTIQVNNATVKWGYGEQTRGSIDGSALKIKSAGKGWRLHFQGGTFTQSWIESAEIVGITVLCEPEGITFEHAELKIGDGRVDFTGVKVAGGARPAVTGTVRLSRVPIRSIAPDTASGMVEGQLSADLKVSGSTNTAEGLTFEGKIQLGDECVVSLRDGIPILRALTVVDLFNNYRRLDFREGSFDLHTVGGVLEARNVDIRAGSLFQLSGHLKIRYPSVGETREDSEKDRKTDQEERRRRGEPIVKEPKAPNGQTQQGPPGAPLTPGLSSAERKHFSELGVFDRNDERLKELVALQSAGVGRAESMRYDGRFTISLPADAFDQTTTLKELFPVNQGSGRIEMTVPIEGRHGEITKSQADKIYEQGKR